MDKFEVFNRLTSIYFDFLKYCIDNNLYCAFYHRLGITRKTLKYMIKYIPICPCSINDISDYNKLVAHLENEPLEDWLKLIISYNRFLSHIKYCYLYNIDRSKSQFIDINDDCTGLYIENKLNNRDFSIEYKFEDSDIIQIGFDSSTDPLTNFIENGVSGNSNNTLTFADVVINNKSENVKNFKFVIGENYKFESEDDQILFNYIKTFTSKCIYESFIDIIDDIGIELYNTDGVNFNIFMYEIVIPQLGGKKHWII